MSKWKPTKSDCAGGLWRKKHLPIGQKVKTEDDRILTVAAYYDNMIGFTGDDIEHGECSWVYFSKELTNVRKNGRIAFVIQTPSRNNQPFHITKVTE